MIIILLELPRASGREFATLLFLPASAARFFERLDRQSRKCLTFLRRASIPRRSTARELNYDNGIHFALSRLASAVSFLSTRFSKCRRPRDMASPSALSLLPPLQSPQQRTPVPQSKFPIFSLRPPLSSVPIHPIPRTERQHELNYPQIKIGGNGRRRL